MRMVGEWKNRFRWIWEKGYLQVFFSNYLIAAASFLPLLLKGDGIFILCNDFNEQQIPFHMLANDAIRSGRFLWNWSIDLGSDLVGALGFYVLGSPFAWLSFLFPAGVYPYITGWLYMAKYALAAASAYGYLRRFAERRYAALGASLYAFSGFQAVNLIFHHFHDAVAFFPFLLIGYEKMAREGKRGSLAAGVCMNALVNYYFFVQEVVFLILYFLCREGVGSWKNRKLVGRCSVEGILGMGMAGILLIPNVLFTMENPRITRLLPMESWFYGGNRDYLQMVRTLLFPGELMTSWSCIREYDWSSWSSYLPMISLSLVLCYIIKKRDWLTGILSLCIVATGIPLLNSAFSLFSDTNYHRWLFMPILMMSLASVRVMERCEEFPVKKVCTGLLALMVLMTAGSFWWSQHRFRLINQTDIFLTWSLTGIVGVLMTFLLACYKGRKGKDNYYVFMRSGILLFSIFTTGLTAWLYQERADRSAQDYYARIMAFREFELPDDRYRIASSDNTLLMAASLSGTGSFTSMVNGSIYEFYEALGTQRLVFTPEGPDGLRELLGGRYRMTIDPEEGERVLQSARGGGDTIYYLCEQNDVVPIGSAYDKYMKESVYEGIPAERRASVLLECIVVPDGMAERVAPVLEECGADEVGREQKEGLVHERCREASLELHRSRTGFSSVIETDGGKYAFFSVPYSKGFRAYVNGERVEILKTVGMMAVPLTAGRNEIRFVYRDDPLAAGLLCTFVCFPVWWYYRKGMKNARVGE